MTFNNQNKHWSLLDSLLATISIILGSLLVNNIFLILNNPNIFSKIFQELYFPFLMLISTWVFSIKKYQIPIKFLGIRKTGRKFILFSVLILIINLLFTGSYNLILNSIFIDFNEINYPDSLLTEKYLYLIFIEKIVFTPFAEEIFFRGFLLSSIKKHLNALNSIMITSVVFALFHLNYYNGSKLLLFMPVFFFSSILFSLIYIKSKSIWPSFISHSSYNSISLIFRLIK